MILGCLRLLDVLSATEKLLTYVDSSQLDDPTSRIENESELRLHEQIGDHIATR